MSFDAKVPPGSVATKPGRGRGGRPTRAEAAARDERLVEVAAALFLERGFEGTSMDALAERAGVSKQTVYARYRDKRELFEAVLRYRIGRWLVPFSRHVTVKAVQPDAEAAEAMLLDLGREMLAFSSTPEALAMGRILSAQTVQFPDLGRLAYEEGWLKAAHAVAQMLTELARQGAIVVPDPLLTADLFLSLVLGRGSRLAVYIAPADPVEQDRRLVAAVRLFLNGVRNGPPPH
ncbi:TetR/AcrR family transcriptional regulator [Siccirubricoccus sp. KC 17139]|uniref:TetR/AcrR family transcriptional regulator n=1 Tax=Siccirubricoccus soli TaxID=2899147 RepID=A0ABT1D3P5_9PROT|nr:TetR/AcrR family transcriptional regulator [Siccirubricoccus soli]MCO6416538.1 TetR/AcrR family transcriptional regulator [Siccirubricoccus soli]MCP2682673.1 TetR/AcrR family transcriptional regulator [Siccirubricoccus soli]